MPPPSVATAAPLPGGRLTALSCLPLEQWLAALGLPAALLPLLDDLGAEQTEDLAHLEAMDVEELCGAAGLKLVQRRKLSKAVRAVRVACGWDNDSGGNGDDAGTKAAPLALAATAPEAGTAVARRRPAPTVARVSSEEVQRHARVLRNYAATAAVDEGTAREAPSDDDVIRSLHVAWAACVAEPFLRRQLLPSLFAIARRPSAGAPEREAALALVFLSFSLSGAAIKVAEPAGSRASGAGPVSSCVSVRSDGSARLTNQPVVPGASSQRLTSGCSTCTGLRRDDLRLAGLDERRVRLAEQPLPPDLPQLPGAHDGRRWR
jgi:hypothetical protein